MSSVYYGIEAIKSISFFIAQLIYLKKYVMDYFVGDVIAFEKKYYYVYI